MKNIVLLTVLITTLTMTNNMFHSDKREMFNIEEIMETSGDGFSTEISYSGEENREFISGETEEEELSIVSGESIIPEIILENIAVNSTMPYYIKINRLQNVVNIYSQNEDGTYAPYKVMLCSIGTATPASGKIYKITTYKTRWNALQGNVYGQYATQIIGNILFHSVPYTAKSNSALEYWEYDKLGTSASLGCVRLTVEDAKWIYDNIGVGTSVEFYEDVNPGPFGKPMIQKISDNEVCRGWDPTDTAEGNPWNSN